jgi:hypothetical protein
LSPNGAPNGAQGDETFSPFAPNGAMLIDSKKFGAQFGAPFCAPNSAHFFLVSNSAPFKTSHTPQKFSLTHHPS